MISFFQLEITTKKNDADGIRKHDGIAILLRTKNPVER